MVKKIIGLTFFCIILVVLVACSSDQEKVEKTTITLLTHDNYQYNYFSKTDNIDLAYSEVDESVRIEIEKVRDSEALLEYLLIRSTAEDLPDVMVLKPEMINRFYEELANLEQMSVVEDNLFAQQYAINGSIYGIPENYFFEFVYYDKQLFERYDLQIPKTWDDFYNLAVDIRDRTDKVPILLGGKDVWPVYPFNEFMPILESGDGKYWNRLYTESEPFSEDKPIYKSYDKIQNLFEADVMGDAYMIMGFEEAKQAFVNGEGAMLLAGQWFISEYISFGGSEENLGMFFLPVRDKLDEILYTTMMVDNFYVISKNSSNKIYAEDFLEWYFHSDYMKDYLGQRFVYSTMKDAHIDIPIIDEQMDFNKSEYLMYHGGHEAFLNTSRMIGFDFKKTGQEMLAGEDFRLIFDELTRKWHEIKKE